VIKGYLGLDSPMLVLQSVCVPYPVPVIFGEAPGENVLKNGMEISVLFKSG
jgi:hypothetical protein